MLTAAVVTLVLVPGLAVAAWLIGSDQGSGPRQEAGPATASSPTPADVGTPGDASSSATASTGASPRSGAATPRSGRPSDSSRPRPKPGQPSVPTATGTVCVDQGSAKPLTVVSYNIHSARSENGGLVLGAVGDTLASYDADIILLQEVDRGRAWTNRVDMPSALASRLGMQWSFGANVRRSASNQYGTAVLSRYPIVSSSNTLLPRPGATQQRGLLHVVVKVHGTELSVYDTHLENTSKTARTMQMRAIAPIIRSDPRPKLFGGDLNSAPGSPAWRLAAGVLTDTWSKVGSGAGLTAPRNPRVRVDYLMYSDGSGADATSIVPQSMSVMPLGPSDHHAVRAVYAVGAPTQICLPQLSGQG